MNIVYFLRDNGGCGYYRADLPLTTVGRNTDHNVMKVEKGDNAKHIERAFEWGDVFLVPRPAENMAIEMIQMLQKEGKKVIVDLDDNMFSISPLSPHYQDYGTENVTIGDKEVWKDGINIDLARNRQILANFARACQLADAVSVTTEKLAEVYREFNENILILPNCINPDLWQKLPLKPHDDIRVYWSGGHSHYEDWVLLKDVMPEIMHRYPQVKLVLLGAKFNNTLSGCPIDRIEYHGWVPTPAYPYKSAILNADISLIPLADNEFNNCKSHIKLVEASTLRVPSVVSYVSPYKEFAWKNNAVFVENDPSAWIEGISTLIESEKLRKEIGQAAYETAINNFSIHDKYPLWIEAYEGVRSR